jgi:2-polyprenyl-3-methyl-5-hydroxy-6-metoxy-1,4-benzoquinol methylase
MNEMQDDLKAEAFASQMMGLLNNACLSLLISIGHQTRLFDMMGTMEAATSHEIAAAAGLHERYVREWLGGMVVGRIVTYDPHGGTYWLPPEHAAFLTRSAGTNNLAFFTQYISVMGRVESNVLRSFREGGGVGYEHYPEFQRLQAEESARLFDDALVDAILPMADGLCERLRNGISVVDLGTGQGHAINVMAQAYPNSRFLGLDFSEEGIQAARTEAAKLGVRNAQFEIADPSAGLSGDFDLVTAFDVIHDLARPRTVLANIARALRPDGVFLMMDMAASSCLEENIAHPIGPLLYTASVMHCMTVSLAQDGEGLGTMWGEQTAQAYLMDAGFTSVKISHLDGDPMHSFYVARHH